MSAQACRQWKVERGPQRRGRWTAALVALFVSASMATAAPFEQALPEDCILFVNVNNIAALKAAVKGTRAAQMYADPAMRPFLDPVYGEINKLIDGLKERIGVDVKDLSNLPTGQISFGLRLFPNDPEENPYAFLLVDVSSNAARVSSLMNQAAGALEQQGMTRRTAGDVTIVSKPDAKPRSSFCFLVKNGVLAVGNDPESLSHLTNAVAAGRPGSLAENQRFREFREKAGGIGDVEVFFDAARTIEAVVNKTGPQSGMAVTVLGLNAFQSAGVSGSIGRGEFESMLQAFAVKRGETALFNLFNMPAKPLRPEAWVPPDTASYNSFSWDLDLLYTTISNIVNSTAPGSMGRIDQQLSQFPNPQNPLITSLQRDVIAPLGSRVSMLSDIGESRGLPVSRMLFALELDEADKVRALISRLIEMAGGALPLQTKTTAGHTIYTFPLGDLFAAQAAADMPVPFGVVGLTVTKSHLYLTTHVEVLDKILVHNGASLGESREYRQVASKYPSQTSGISFVRTDKQMAASWQVVKSGKFAEQLRQLTATVPNGDRFDPLIDSLRGDRLPDVETVSKYFAPAGGYIVMDNDGVRFVQFTLK